MPIRNSLIVGDAKITLIEEMVMPTSVKWLLPEYPDPYGLLEKSTPWLKPHYINEKGHLLQSIHSWIVEVDGMKVVIDTGIGDNKNRQSEGFEGWHMKQGSYLQDLEKAGVPADSIDFVINTHLHQDHAGWNTKLVEKTWVPTFNNARYKIVTPEWDYWTSDEIGPVPIIEDSVIPVFKENLVDLVAADYKLSDSITFEPSHGHTPGHVCIHISSQDQTAIITGDLLHNPIQCAAPEARPTFDKDAVPARKTRTTFLEKYANTETLILGTHFHHPAAGVIRSDNNFYRYESVD